MPTPLRSALSAAALAAALALTGCASATDTEVVVDAPAEAPATIEPSTPAAPATGVASCPDGFLDELNVLGESQGAHFIEVDANALIETSNVIFPGTGCFFQFENNGSLGPVTAVFDAAVLPLADAQGLLDEAGYTVADPADNPGQYYLDGTVIVAGNYLNGEAQVKGVTVFGDELFQQIGDDLTMIWAF